MVIYSPTISGSIASSGSSTFTTMCATTAVCSPTICGTSDISAPNVCATSILCGNIIYSATCICTAAIRLNSAGTANCAICVDSNGLFAAYTAGGGGSSPMVAGTGGCSIVGNCTLNSAATNCSFVGGGICNRTCFGAMGISAIVGGCANTTCNDYSFIGAGLCNTTLGIASAIVGGCQQVVCGAYSFTGTGYCNTNFANNSAIVGGGNNNTSCNTCFSFIGGGCQNNICANSITYGFFSAFNTILSGCNNCICCNCYNLIGGGAGNTIVPSSFYGCNNSFNTIINGCNGCANGQFGFIGNSSVNIFFSGCTSNTLTCNTYGATILNGTCNCVYNGGGTFIINCFGTILGGCQNCVGCNFGLAFGQSSGAYQNFTTVIGCNLSGNIGCTMYVNNMCVCGTLSKVAGSFRIPHPDPTKPTKDLIHSFVESPTAGENIYRYSVTTSGCAATLALPEYYSFLNCDDQVFVTPKNHFGTAYGIVNEAQTCVTFCSNIDGDYNVLIIGTRKDQHAADYWRGAEVDSVLGPQE